MNKIIFKDNTEFEILEGASLSNIQIKTSDFNLVIEAITKENNLDLVTFTNEGEVSGEYHNLKNENPLFHVLEKDVVLLSLSEKSQMEIDIDELKQGQLIQDGAIADIGEVIGGE